VTDRLLEVELTTSFLNRLELIEVFLTEADAASEYDNLLAELRETVIPNLSRFPAMGRRYLDDPPQSAEALVQLSLLSAGATDTLCEYIHGDYLLLYSKTEKIIYLLSIRHHRQLSFDFVRMWPK